MSEKELLDQAISQAKELVVTLESLAGRYFQREALKFVPESKPKSETPQPKPSDKDDSKSGSSFESISASISKPVKSEGGDSHE